MVYKAGGRKNPVLKATMKPPEQPPRLVDIPQELPGFHHFFAPWLVQDDLVLLVDVGPASWTPRLIEALHGLGVDRVDYVLLTHIHIDHAGGLGDFLTAYPSARVLCHAKGIPYMVEPTKLWEGSRQVLGSLAETFGAPRPVPAGRLVPHTENPVPGLQFIETPGHAAHHLSFLYGGYLFAGEAAGNYFVCDGEEYLRPATPPRFFLDVSLASIDRLLALGDRPIYFPHCGTAARSHPLLQAAAQQLLRWKAVIAEQLRAGEADITVRSTSALLEQDPMLHSFRLMKPAEQDRERFFMGNSIQGFLGYLTSTAGAA